MSCIKKIKYIMMVLFIAGIVQGYFLMTYFLITNIDDSIGDSLDYYKIISSRGPNFNSFIAFYRESLAINETLYMLPGQYEHNNNMTRVKIVDYFQ